MASVVSPAPGASVTRPLLLGLSGIVALLIGISVGTYTAFFSQSGALFYLAEPLVLLGGYVALTIAVTRQMSVVRQQALRIGIAVGVITGAVWVVNLSIETFAPTGGGIFTAIALLGGFALWGVAGFLAARGTGRFGLGVLAAVISAMLCVLITVTYGFLLSFVALGRLETLLVHDPDFLRSKWTDLHAFVLANQSDAAFSHLLGGLVVSLVTGSIGSGLGRGSRQRQMTANA